LASNTIYGKSPQLQMENKKVETQNNNLDKSLHNFDKVEVRFLAKPKQV